jgi:hypothetical protein
MAHIREVRRNPRLRYPKRCHPDVAHSAAEGSAVASMFRFDLVS